MLFKPIPDKQANRHASKRKMTNFYAEAFTKKFLLHKLKFYDYNYTYTLACVYFIFLKIEQL